MNGLCRLHKLLFLSGYRNWNGKKSIRIKQQKFATKKTQSFEIDFDTKTEELLTEKNYNSMNVASMPF